MFWTTLNNKIMRKVFAILTLSVALAGCGKQPNDNGPLDVSVNEPITTSIRVSIDETRAAGVDSAEGIFAQDILDDENITIRYILQIYIKNNSGNYIAATRHFAYSDTIADNGDSEAVEFFPTLIPGRDYKFVVWADVVTNGATNTDNHYDTTDLANISLRGEWNAMDETRDAFTGYAVEEDFMCDKAVNIDLTRPFAKLRIVATETGGTSRPAKGVFTYASTLRQSFNAVTGTAAAASLAGKGHTFAVGEYTTEEANTMTLFTDYLFAVDDTIDIEFAFYENEGDAEPLMGKRYEISDVAIRRNSVTSIKGQVLKGEEITFGDITIKDWGSGGEIKARRFGK